MRAPTPPARGCAPLTPSLHCPLAVARRSAVGAAVFAALLLPWALGFLFAGAGLVGARAWEALAVTRWAATNTQARAPEPHTRRASDCLMRCKSPAATRAG